MGITVTPFYRWRCRVKWFCQCQAASKPYRMGFSNSIASQSPPQILQPLCQKCKEISLPVLRENCFGQRFLLILRTTQKHVTMVNHLQEQEVTRTWLQGASQRVMVTNGGHHDLQTGSKHQSNSILPRKEIVSPWHTPSTESNNNKKGRCKVVPMLCPGTRAEALTSPMAN